MKKAVGSVKKGIPLSPGISSDGYVFVSGQVGDVDESGAPVSGIQRQTEMCLKRVSSVLQDAGTSLANVVKVTVFLKDGSDFAKMNEVYGRIFSTEPPARSTVVVGLVRESMLIEIECIAAMG
jgi:2-iminobutanoate/2-iminopropanoate deaminase